MSISLNIPQEQELQRLVDYEQATCSMHGNLVYRCAFPYYPQDELQAELIAKGALARKADRQRGTVVVITTDGYSYLMEKQQEALERHRRARNNVLLVILSALCAALCVVVGFYLGHYVV